jgi:RNA polymerase sigma-70 factor (ECF subfamily)
MYGTNSNRMSATASPETGMDVRCLGQSDEQTLLERARAYDLVALEAIYDRHAPKVRSYLYRRIGDADLADDLTAQVFLHMLQAIRDDKAWTTSFSGWLYRIAHNLMVDHLRRFSGTGRVSLDDAPPLLSPDGDPVAIADERLAWERLAAAIARLTDEQAEVVVLRFLEGLSIAEAAQVMDKSEGAVKALQYRAVLALRRLVSDAAETERAERPAQAPAGARSSRRPGSWQAPSPSPAVA